MLHTLWSLLIAVHGVISVMISAGSTNPTGGTANPSWLSWWPTRLGQPWLLVQLGIAGRVPTLLVVLIGVAGGAALVLAGLGNLGVLVPQTAVRTLMGVGAAASLAVLVVFLHPFYAIGILLNICVLIARRSV